MARNQPGPVPPACTDRHLDGAGEELQRASVADDWCRRILWSQGGDIASRADPLETELWVSQLLGMDHPSPEGAGASESIGDRLVAICSAVESLPARACLHALATMGSPATAGRARSALEASARRRVAAPGWVGSIGTARPSRAYRGTDHFGDQDSVMVEFTYPDGRPHCVLVLIDHLLGGGAKDVAVIPVPLDEVLCSWMTDPDVILVSEDVTSAGGRILTALERTTTRPGAQLSTTVVESAAFLRARLHPVARPHSAAEGVGVNQRDAVIRAFLASDAGGPFGRQLSARTILRSMVDFRCDLGLDPLRWSGAAVEQYLCDPCAAPPPGSGPVRRDSATMLLATFVAWAGAMSGTPERLIEDAVEAVTGLDGRGMPPFGAVEPRQPRGASLRV